MRGMVFLVILAGLFAVPGAAGQVADAVDRAAVGRDAQLQQNGLYAVELSDGHTLLSHGADPPPPDHGQLIGPGDPERPPACTRDYHQHVLYGRPVGQPDRLAEVRAQLVSAMGRMNAILNEEALLTGGVTADYRVLCERDGTTLRIDSFVNAASSSFQDIADAARRAGFRSWKADYTIFYDGPPPAPNICGIGSFSPDDRLTARNRNNSGGGYAVTYPACWNGRTPMHENGHNQGAVQYGAPNSTGTGAHCIDDLDVMCYTPDGGDRNQLATVLWCPEAVHFDCRNDDYFDAAPEPGEWLSTHWNIGSPLNRFLNFGI